METIIIAIFTIGYLAIIFESYIKINKAAPALVAGVLCWAVLAAFGGHISETLEKLHLSIGETGGILFFLLGAMTIVELIESHQGFDIITKRITTRNSRLLLWIIAWITFFLSSILDNLTTTIVMLILMQKLLSDREARIIFAGVIVIAANAGGAWSPIGDVTTIMLWIGDNVSTLGVIQKLILPSIASLLLPLVLATLLMNRKTKIPAPVPELNGSNIEKKEKNIVFFTGIGALLFVPVFKTLTHLPPYMGILIGLGVLWLVTELLHKKKHEEERMNLSVLKALRKMDMTTILFYLGILLAVSSLETAGILGKLGNMVDETFHSPTLLTVLIGFLSAVIGNVPMVAAAIGMYPLTVFPTDHDFWNLLAYSSGTGGSMLIIGSAAGVAAMAIEKIDFFKYLKKISWLALLGFLAGIGVYLLQGMLFK